MNMKKQIKSFIEIENQAELSTVIGEFVSALCDNEHLMGVTVQRAIKKDTGAHIFGLEFVVVVGELPEAN